MRRRALLGAAAGCLLSACSRHSKTRPSILLISIDTLRADRLNCYGYKRRIVSPSLDALAGQSVLFERHITASPWTTPSHLSLLTSLWPTAHGVTLSAAELTGRLLGNDRIAALSDRVPTLPQILHGNRWTTAAFTGGITLDPRIGFGRGFDYYDTSMYKLGDQNMARLIGWIGDHRDQRQMVFWHTFEVHAPYLAGAFLGDVVSAGTARRLATALRQIDLVDARASAPRGQRVLEDHDVFSAKVTSALYDGGILSVDTRIGQVLERLRHLGLFDDMLIVVTSDHGEQLGERDGAFYDSHGKTLYDEMIRVPLIVKLPRQAFAGRRIRSITRAVDVMPTILDLGDIPAHGLALQGRSLRPLWESSAPGPDRLALTESTTTEFELKGVRLLGHEYILRISAEDVARQGRATIPASPQGLELYDLEADPTEAHNLLSRAACGEGCTAAKGLAAELDRRLRAEVSARVGHYVTHAGDGGVMEGLRALGYLE